MLDINQLVVDDDHYFDNLGLRKRNDGDYIKENIKEFVLSTFASLADEELGVDFAQLSTRFCEEFRDNLKACLNYSGINAINFKDFLTNNYPPGTFKPGVHGRDEYRWQLTAIPRDDDGLFLKDLKDMGRYAHKVAEKAEEIKNDLSVPLNHLKAIDGYNKLYDCLVDLGATEEAKMVPFQSVRDYWQTHYNANLNKAECHARFIRSSLHKAIGIPLFGDNIELKMGAQAGVFSLWLKENARPKYTPQEVAQLTEAALKNCETEDERKKVKELVELKGRSAEDAKHAFDPNQPVRRSMSVAAQPEQPQRREDRKVSAPERRPPNNDTYQGNHVKMPLPPGFGGAAAGHTGGNIVNNTNEMRLLKDEKSFFDVVKATSQSQDDDAMTTVSMTVSESEVAYSDDEEPSRGKKKITREVTKAEKYGVQNGRAPAASSAGAGSRYGSGTDAAARNTQYYPNAGNVAGSSNSGGPGDRADRGRDTGVPARGQRNIWEASLASSDGQRTPRAQSPVPFVDVPPVQHYQQPSPVRPIAVYPEGNQPTASMHTQTRRPDPYVADTRNTNYSRSSMGTSQAPTIVRGRASNDNPTLYQQHHQLGYPEHHDNLGQYAAPPSMPSLDSQRTTPSFRGLERDNFGGSDFDIRPQPSRTGPKKNMGVQTDNEYLIDLVTEMMSGCSTPTPSVANSGLSMNAERDLEEEVTELIIYIVKKHERNNKVVKCSEIQGKLHAILAMEVNPSAVFAGRNWPEFIQENCRPRGVSLHPDRRGDFYLRFDEGANQFHR